MMTYKTALTTDTTELVNYYNHASRLARILLTSHEKHGDLPLVMHAQACLVLGCSDEDDCYERMEEAVVLLNNAMEEGALEKEQGEAMIETCEMVMGMRGQTLAMSDDEDDEDDAEDEGEREGEENRSKDEAADEGGGYGRNDALP
jgi:phosphopantothenoylcysteine synthetase/decarboxylase